MGSFSLRFCDSSNKNVLSIFSVPGPLLAALPTLFPVVLKIRCPYRSEE